MSASKPKMAELLNPPSNHLLNPPSNQSELLNPPLHQTNNLRVELLNPPLNASPAYKNTTKRTLEGNIEFLL